MPVDMTRVAVHAPVSETMVDRRTGRTWTVDVHAFEIARTVVTVEQWDALNGAETRSSRANLPKVDVSWRQAVAFCNELSQQEGLDPAYAITTIEPATGERPAWTPHSEPAPDDWCVAWDVGGARIPPTD